MPKSIGIALLCALMIIIFIQPVREYMNNVFRRQVFHEERFVGTVSTYNPRVREIQIVLHETGYYNGVYDGFMGEDTRAAIRRFQETLGLKTTGHINAETMLSLNRLEKSRQDMVSSQAQDQKVTVTEGVPPPYPSPQGGGNRGEMKGEAGMRNISPPLTGGDRGGESPPQKIEATAWGRRIQSALHNAEFYNGAIDGKIGSATRDAVRAFQKAHGFKADGVVGNQTWKKLRTYL